MCGIVGVIGSRAAAPLLLDSLRRLEYRGYDSAGIATLVNGHIDRRRAEGKLGNLAEVLERNPLPGTTGIGHTRWATHGVPNETNAHPHGTARVSVVHNGIIENHAELRAELEAAGQEFSTETDTETVAQLVDLHLQQGMDPVSAAGAAFRRLEGAYALAMIFAGHPELIVGAQHGAPLAVGFGEDEMFVGSDALALAPLTRRIAYLKDGDWAVVDRQGARFFGAGRRAGRARGQADAADRGLDRQGQLPPLHGEGAARAPGGDRRHAAPDGQSGDPRGGAAGAAVRFRYRAAHHHQRLRQRVLCRAGRTLVVRGGGAHPDRCRRRQRVPLPHAADDAGRARHPGQPVRRDRRHDGGAALHARAGPVGAVDRQRAGEQHGARVRRRAGDGGGAGDRCRQHQGVHRAACRCWPAWRWPRRARAARSPPRRKRR